MNIQVATKPNSGVVLFALLEIDRAEQSQGLRREGAGKKVRPTATPEETGRSINAFPWSLQLKGC